MRKFTVGVCEDETFIHDTVKDLLCRYGKKRDIEYEAVSFFSGEELLKSEQEMDMLFLDIAMPGQNGIETARKLNQQGKYKVPVSTRREKSAEEAFMIFP